jgi:flagellar hook capping protein FlgD
MDAPRPVWLSAALVAAFLLGAPQTARASAPHGAIHPAPTIFDNSARMDANNLDMAVTNHGSFAYDLLTGGAGLIYPKGTANSAVFAAGVWIGAKVGGDVRVAVAAYGQEFVPGPMLYGTYQPDDIRFKSYRIDRGNTTSPDYLNWPSQDGAPLDSLGQPALLGDAMVWSVYNDANPSLHTDDAGQTEPLNIEIQQSTFAFNRSGALGNVIFLKFKLLNKGLNQLDNAYFALWADPDLGGFTDDLVGCDTTRSLGYCYNATNADQQYGSSPPAVGFSLLQGPAVPVSPGVYDTLGMTGFARYTNGTDPTSATETYNSLSGLHADGTPIYVNDDLGQPITTFEVSGLDPGSASGPTNWLDSNPADRRLFVTSGPFAFAPGDSQEIVAAICVGQGSDRLSSVSDLQVVQGVAREMYQAGFQTEPPTAVTAALLESAAQPDRVRLVWRVLGAELVTAAVFRREERSDWALLGTPTLDGGTRLRFEDDAVRPGTRYGYRLVVRDVLGEETSIEDWVDVPLEAAPQAASLRFAAANPSGGAVEIRYGLPTGGPARLDVYDVRGARIATLTNGPSTAGWHGMIWNGRDSHGRPVGSGIYLLRLETKSGAVVRKLTVAR